MIYRCKRYQRHFFLYYSIAVYLSTGFSERIPRTSILMTHMKGGIRKEYLIDITDHVLSPNLSFYKQNVNPCRRRDRRRVVYPSRPASNGIEFIISNYKDGLLSDKSKIIWVIGIHSHKLCISISFPSFYYPYCSYIYYSEVSKWIPSIPL